MILLCYACARVCDAVEIQWVKKSAKGSEKWSEKRWFSNKPSRSSRIAITISILSSVAFAPSYFYVFAIAVITLVQRYVSSLYLRLGRMKLEQECRRVISFPHGPRKLNSPRLAIQSVHVSPRFVSFSPPPLPSPFPGRNRPSAATSRGSYPGQYISLQ